MLVLVRCFNSYASFFSCDGGGMWFDKCIKPTTIAALRMKIRSKPSKSLFFILLHSIGLIVNGNNQ